jgi:hypothetical protein
MRLQELNSLRNSIIEKSEIPFEKARGKAAYVGEIREYDGVKWVKTHDGWIYYKKGAYRHYDSKTKETTIAKTHHVEHYGKHIDVDKEKTPLKDVVKEEIKKDLIGDIKTGDKISDYEIIGSLGGSSDVKLTELEKGEKYALKPPREKSGTYINEQNEQEVIVDNIYSILGYKAPDSKIIKDGEKSYKLSKFEENYKQLNNVPEIFKKDIYKEIQKGFVLDCLLGNWDVIGANKDNILVNNNNEILRIDNGGSLDYRARGSKKPDSEFGPEIKELKTFLDGTNPSTKEVFYGITDDEIKSQAKDILSRKVDILYEISKLGNVNLTKKVSERLQWLEKNIANKEEDKEGSYDKTKYSSKVTSDYFKDFNSLEIEGNKGIKEGIKRQILKIEKLKEPIYKKFADIRKIEVEEYKKLLQGHVEKIMSETQYFRATDINVIEKILINDGRFKSQFETGTSHGSYSPEHREEAENNLFKFGNKEENKENRPIYGYCTENQNGVSNYKLEIPPENNTLYYGQVSIKIKKDVALKKATVTFADSLGISNTISASPVSKPHFTSLQISNYGEDPLDKYSSTGKRDSAYTEIQYHNQLKFEDIESVHISPNTKGYEDYDLVNRVIELSRKTNVPIKIFGKS